MGGKVLVPTQAVHPHARRRAPRGRRLRRADACSSPAPTPTARSSSPATSTSATAPFIVTRRAHAGGLLPREEPASSTAIARGLAYAPYADLVWCETGTPDLAEAQRVRRGHPRASSRASCSPTTARRPSTGRRTSTTRPSRSSSASSAPWATSSSSSRWPASTRSTSRCSSWRATTRTRGMAAYIGAAAGGVRRRGARLHGHAPPARGRHRLLRRGDPGGERRRVLAHGARRQHRGAAVCEREAAPGEGGVGTPQTRHRQSRSASNSHWIAARRASISSSAATSRLGSCAAEGS